MNKPFSTMKTNIGNMVQDTSNATATLIGVWINNRYRDIVNAYDWEQLYVLQGVTSTASVSAYALDENTDRLMTVLDVTNDKMPEIITEQQYIQQHWDDTTTTGTPEYCFLKRDCVSSQPASAEALTVKSSSASDTTQTVLIRGISDSQETYETVTLTGTTVASAANSYTRILGLSKSAVTVGKVTIMDNDESTTHSVMSRESLESHYRLLTFHYIPSGTIVYKVRTKRRVTPLSQTADYPVINDIEDIIEMGAAADAWRYERQFAKAKEMEMVYSIMKAERIQHEVAQPGLVHQFSPTPLNRDEGIL